MRPRALFSLAAASCLFLVGLRGASAQQPGEDPAGAPYAEPAPPPPPLEEPYAAAPAPAAPAAPARVAGTDHDQVVGRWGVEARRLATVQKTPNQDLGCREDCPVQLNALGIRHWASQRYAWTVGLALGAGSGTTRTPMTGVRYSWDTYFGVGPTVGATFLLANWQHLAVGLSPQIDLVYFLPGASREKPKTFLLNFRGLVEGEVHLGFIGLPQLSVGVGSGLVASYRNVSSAANTPTGTSAEWAIGMAGPQTLWGLVTNMFLRFYF